MTYLKYIHCFVNEANERNKLVVVWYFSVVADHNDRVGHYRVWCKPHAAGGPTHAHVNLQPVVAQADSWHLAKCSGFPGDRHGRPQSRWRVTPYEQRFRKSFAYHTPIGQHHHALHQNISNTTRLSRIQTVEKYNQPNHTLFTTTSIHHCQVIQHDRSIGQRHSIPSHGARIP